MIENTGTVIWQIDPDFPHEYFAQINGQKWVLNVQEFDNDIWLYRLTIDGKEIVGFDDSLWPKEWIHPIFGDRDEELSTGTEASQ